MLEDRVSNTHSVSGGLSSPGNWKSLSVYSVCVALSLSFWHINGAMHYMSLLPHPLPLKCLLGLIHSHSPTTLVVLEIETKSLCMLTEHLATALCPWISSMPLPGTPTPPVLIVDNITPQRCTPLVCPLSKWIHCFKFRVVEDEAAAMFACRLLCGHGFKVPCLTMCSSWGKCCGVWGMTYLGSEP